MPKSRLFSVDLALLLRLADGDLESKISLVTLDRLRKLGYLDEEPGRPPRLNEAGRRAATKREA